MKFAVVLFVFSVLLGLTKGEAELCENDKQCNQVGCAYCDPQGFRCRGCYGECNSDDYCHGKYKTLKSNCACLYQQCSYGCSEHLVIATGPATGAGAPAHGRPHMVGHGRY